MKKLFFISLGLLGLVWGCTKTDPNAPADDLPKKLQLSNTQVNVALLQSEIVPITSGNGNYSLAQTQESKAIAQVSVVAESVVVKGLTLGTATATLTDNKTKQSITLIAVVRIAEKDYQINDDKVLLKWNNTTATHLNFRNDPILKDIVAVGQGAFAGKTHIISVVLPNSVKSIGEKAFSGCTALKEVQLPDNSDFKTIARRAFEDCKSLQTIDLPESIDEIGILAFADANIHSVTLPENLVTIGQQAFVGNKNLSTITIPRNVSLISTAAFQETGLVIVRLKGTLPPSLVFATDANTKQSIEPFPSATLQRIIVPAEATESYRNSNKGWHNYASLINKHIPFKKLVITPTEVTLFVDDVKFLEVEGNDDYDIQRDTESRNIAQFGILPNQKRFGVRGKKAGTTQVTVIDKVTKQKVVVTITVKN